MEQLNRWELFSHKADVGVRGQGKSIAEAFAMGAMALTAAVTDPKKVAPTITIPISCSAPDLEFLFVDWLNAIIYEMDTRNMLFSQFDVTLHQLSLEAKISGEIVNPNKHQPAVYVKGATYTELKVIQHNSLWLAQCVIDV